MNKEYEQDEIILHATTESSEMDALYEKAEIDLLRAALK